MSILYIILGAVLVMWGADRFTEGAGSVARRLNVPQIVIGLTIVAMGTSMPELSVSLASALQGTADMAVGNVVGSNIFNVLLIVGCSAAVAPIAVSRRTVGRDLPFTMIASLMLIAFCLNGQIERWEGLIMLAVFAGYMLYTLRVAKQSKGEEPEEEASQPLGWLMSIVWIVIGIGCLIGGSKLFVVGASAVAKSLGVSDAVIGLTVVACGTSLPELATSVVAARKGQGGLAIGNVIGSNVFNILMILGITGTIVPLHLEGITNIDLGTMAASAALMWLMCRTKYLVERWEGLVMIVLFVGYMGWLLMVN